MASEGEDPARVAAFIEHVRGGGLVEADDWMPEAYRRTVGAFIEMHANSEYMGALLERDWLSRTPSLERKLALASKVQDEIGHAQLLYRILADLGRPIDAAIDDLIAGKTKFHWFFHYKAKSWADAGIIAWLSDSAAAIAQVDLSKGSYAPYRRALNKICWEERFHITYGQDVMEALMTGTDAQRDMAQQALDDWWGRLLAFNGPPTPPEEDPNITTWCIKHMSNEDMRQRFLSQNVKHIEALGLKIRDENLKLDEATGTWSYTQPDWKHLRRYRYGEGPATAEWLALRRASREENAWVYETLTRARRAAEG